MTRRLVYELIVNWLKGAVSFIDSDMEKMEPRVRGIAFQCREAMAQLAITVDELRTAIEDD